jgi:hypothetical protein
MGYQDSSNLYAFAGGDPVNGRDPRGEENAADASRATQAKVPQHVVAVWENTRLPNDNVAALQLLFQIWLGEQAKGFLSNFQFGEGFADAIASFRGGRYVNALNDLITDAGRGMSLFALFRSLGPRGGIRPPTPPRTAPAPLVLVTPEGVMVPAGTGGAIPMANPPTGLIGPPVILASSVNGSGSRWKQYEQKHGGQQTPMEIDDDGKPTKVRLDKPPTADTVVDFKDYDWSNPSYNKPFLRGKVIEEFTEQIRKYQKIRPNVHLQFSEEPPAWIVTEIQKAGATYSVVP